MIQQNKLTVADIKKLQSRKLLSAQFENEEKYQKYNFEYEKNLKLLKLANLKRKTFYPTNKAKIINDTGIFIPPEVISLLKLGNEHSIGGFTKKDSSDIYLELNKLWETFLPESRKLGVSEIDIQNIKSYIHLCGNDLTNCSTRDFRVSAFFKFKKEFSEIVMTIYF